MKRIDLTKKAHRTKIGSRCEYLDPNVQEDCELWDNGERVGFYLHNLDAQSEKLTSLMVIADHEFRSKNVPKQLLERSDVFKAVYTDGMTRKQAKATQTIQYSTIIGSIPPKPHMRRPYPSRSSVHSVPSARKFIKAMLMAAEESAMLIERYMPEQFQKQLREMETVPEKWRFGRLFTSSISNFNISAPYHQDNANLPNSVNVIITKRANSRGGSLAVPDYGAVFEQPDSSMLVYPAWRNMHGVTPIVPTHDGGYRNSLIFYALRAFQEK
jgi:hypothetical protein